MVKGFSEIRSRGYTTYNYDASAESLAPADFQPVRAERCASKGFAQIRLDQENTTSFVQQISTSIALLA
jgi:hypothetical protein